MWAIGGADAAARARVLLPRLNLVSYIAPAAAGETHPWLTDVDAQVRRGQVVARALQQLQDKGIALRRDRGPTPAGAEAMFVKDVFPATPLLTYFEFFYAATGADVGFGPRVPHRPRKRPAPARAQHAAPGRAERLRRGPDAHALAAVDRCRASTGGRVAVSHEGIDTDAVRPDPAARFEWLGRVFEAGQPVVTYVARNLEPYRGIHVFLRALPALLAAVPDAQVIVVGGDDVSYGLPAPHPQGWRAALVGGTRQRRHAARCGARALRRQAAACRST